MDAQYVNHHRGDAQGHITIHGPIGMTINLVGAAAMSQMQLDFFGELFEKAIRDMTPEQIEQARRLNTSPRD